MVVFIEKGDIFKIDGVSSYAHGCNCAGAMGRGIAVQFRDKFPDMYDTYTELCKTGRFNPGDVYDYDYGNGHVYNLGTQKTWRTSARLEYIRASLEKMLTAAKERGVSKIALPAIGAGLGGLSWPEVKDLIREIGDHTPDITLYVVEEFSNEPRI